MKMIGWYSRKQEDKFADSERRQVAVYETNHGNTVEVTEVIEGEERRSNFDDAVCVGEVTRYIRSRPAARIRRGKETAK